MADLVAGTPTVLTWVAHPARRRLGRGLIVAGLLGVLGVAIGWWRQSIFWGVFSTGVLFLSLESFFLPTRYKMGETELSVSKAFSSSRNEWGTFRRVYEDRHGLTLSPYRRRTFLEPYRSQRVLFDGGDAEAIRAEVRRRCPEADWITAVRRQSRDVADRTG